MNNIVLFCTKYYAHGNVCIVICRLFQIAIPCSSVDSITIDRNHRHLRSAQKTKVE